MANSDESPLGILVVKRREKKVQKRDANHHQASEWRSAMQMCQLIY